MTMEQLVNIRNGSTKKAIRAELSGLLSEMSIPGANLDRAGQNIANDLLKHMRIDWAAIGVIAEGSEEEEDKVIIRPVSSHVNSEWALGDTISLTDTPIEWVANNRRHIEEGDLKKTSLFWTGSALVNKGIVSAAYVPLFAWGGVFGCLMVGSNQPRTYGREELSLLRYAATRLAMVLDNYRALEGSRRKTGAQFALLLEDSKREVRQEFVSQIEANKRNTEEQAFIRKLVGTVSYGESLSHSVPIAMQQLKERVNFDYISFASIQGERVHYHMSISPTNSSPRAGEIYPLRDCAAAWVIRHKVPHIENDIHAERQFPIDEIYLRHGMRSVIRLPLLSNDGVFATINLASCQPGTYGEAERKFLQELCTHLSPSAERIYLCHKERERMEFLKAISHEVKTPLTSIISSARLLAEESGYLPESPQARLIDNVVKGATHMEERITLFLDLAVVEAPEFKLRAVPTDIVPLLQAAMIELLPTAQNKGRLLMLDVSEYLPKVQVDQERVKQIASILLKNGIAFSPDDSVIRLHAVQKDNHVVVSVQDSGNGFSPEEQVELFKTYHPIDDRQKSPEIRVGLAIANQLVALHGGTLSMESAVGSGSTFFFTLPIAT